MILELRKHGRRSKESQKSAETIIRLMSGGQLCYRPEQAPDAFFLFSLSFFFPRRRSLRSCQVEQQMQFRLFFFGAKCFKKRDDPG